jgi:hypothetical protein
MVFGPGGREIPVALPLKKYTSYTLSPGYQMPPLDAHGKLDAEEHFDQIILSARNMVFDPAPDAPLEDFEGVKTLLATFLDDLRAEGRLYAPHEAPLLRKYHARASAQLATMRAYPMWASTQPASLAYDRVITYLNDHYRRRGPAAAHASLAATQGRAMDVVSANDPSDPRRPMVPLDKHAAQPLARPPPVFDSRAAEVQYTYAMKKLATGETVDASHFSSRRNRAMRDGMPRTSPPVSPQTRLPLRGGPHASLSSSSSSAAASAAAAPGAESAKGKRARPPSMQQWEGQ